MSYKLKARFNRTKWFDKSFDGLGLKTGHRWDHYRTWEAKYGYKISLDKFGWPCYVVFPNEAEATMFMLKWT